MANTEPAFTPESPCASSHRTAQPSDWIVRFAPRVAAGQSLLDLACGHGRHARYFAARGVRVTAVDRDTAALASLASVNGVVVEARDLELPNAPWPYAAGQFDAVVVCNYLWRPTFEALLASIKPGGVLLYETFMDGNERFGKPSRPDFLLRSNELLHRTRDVFRVVAFEQGEIVDASGRAIACTQKICAEKVSV